MTALQDLLAKVEAGSFPGDASASSFGLTTDTGLPIVATMYKAFSGSLDDARELHEAMLPEWSWGVGSHGAGVSRPVSSVLYDKWVHNPIPARAWLIAILKALIEKETPE